MAKTPPLIFEDLQDTTNQLYITLLEYKKVKYLTIIENSYGEEVQAYVLDSLEAEGIDQEWFMSVVTRWFYAASHRYPLSFEFAKLGAGEVVKKVLKTFNINSISRIIGRMFCYPVNDKPKVRRRKVVRVDGTADIKLKSLV